MSIDTKVYSSVAVLDLMGIGLGSVLLLSDLGSAMP